MKETKAKEGINIQAKEWFVKTCAEFLASLILSLVLIGVGALVGAIKSFNQQISAGNVTGPLYVVVVLFIYVLAIRCTFPISEGGSGR